MSTAAFTPEEVEKIKELRRKGYPWTRVAQKIGRSLSVVYETFSPNRFISPNDRRTIMDMRRQGMTWRAIAEHFNVNEDTLRNRIRRGKQTPEETAERIAVAKEHDIKFRPGKKPVKTGNIVTSIHKPDPIQLEERERRYAMINKQSLADQWLGDPPQGFSALARLTPDQLKNIRGG